MENKQYHIKKERSAYPIIVICAVILLVLGIVNSLLRSDTKTSFLFNDSYGIFIETFKQHESSVFLPGSGNNPSRQELNVILEKVLTKTISAEERLSDSLLGLEKVKEVRKQIDELTKTGTLFDKATNQLEKKIKTLPNNKVKHAKMIVRSAREYNEVTHDIENFLYVINDDGKEIFERIIAEDGNLSEDHIITLNEHIPEAETNFDALSFLYNDLTDIKTEVETNYSILNNDIMK